MKQIADGPFTKDIMAECNAVASQIAQCFTRDQIVDSLGGVITYVQLFGV
jgi:hypothetical protein